MNRRFLIIGGSGGGPPVVPTIDSQTLAWTDLEHYTPSISSSVNYTNLFVLPLQFDGDTSGLGIVPNILDSAVTYVGGTGESGINGADSFTGHITTLDLSDGNSGAIINVSVALVDNITLTAFQSSSSLDINTAQNSPLSIDWTGMPSNTFALVQANSISGTITFAGGLNTNGGIGSLELDASDCSSIDTTAFQNAADPISTGSITLNCAGDVTTVDNFFINLNTSGNVSGCTLVTSGTSASPSSDSVAARTALLANGNTITTN